MARTTAAAVLAIMDNCQVSSDDIDDYYIPTANVLITQIFEDDSEMEDSELTAIEQWFTAHMLASSRHRSAKTEKVGTASVTYTGTFKEYLSSTPYGQMVLQLDRTGLMADAGLKAASIRAIKSFD